MDNRHPDDLSYIGQLGGLAMVANTPPDVLKARMANARNAMRQQDLDAVDKNRELPTEERERLADLRRRERMARAGLASGRARRAAKAKADAAAEINVLLDVLAALNAEDGAA